MNLQTYRKPPHCLCSFLKCFQKKIISILHRQSQNMFATDKRLPHTFFFFFFSFVASIESWREQVICLKFVPEPRPLSVHSPVLCFNHETIPFLALIRRLECAYGQDFPSQGQTHEKEKKKKKKQDT